MPGYTLLTETAYKGITLSATWCIPGVKVPAYARNRKILRFFFLPARKVWTIARPCRPADVYLSAFVGFPIVVRHRSGRKLSHRLAWDPNRLKLLKLRNLAPRLSGPSCAASKLFNWHYDGPPSRSRSQPSKIEFGLMPLTWIFLGLLSFAVFLIRLLLLLRS